MRQIFPTNEAYSIVNIIRDLAAKAEPNERILYICLGVDNCSFVKYQRGNFPESESMDLICLFYVHRSTFNPASFQSEITALTRFESGSATKARRS